jgi:hypothetical protein
MENFVKPAKALKDEELSSANVNEIMPLNREAEPALEQWMDNAHYRNKHKIQDCLRFDVADLSNTLTLDQWLWHKEHEGLLYLQDNKGEYVVSLEDYRKGIRRA